MVVRQTERSKIWTAISQSDVSPAAAAGEREHKYMQVPAFTC